MSMVDHTAIEKAKDFFTISFLGRIRCIKYGAPHINEGGSVTLMSGSFGQRPSKGYRPRCYSFVEQWTPLQRAMAVELAP